jgi:ubiquinone/menaquinone biosynthesis C-methylase UbiE
MTLRNNRSLAQKKLLKEYTDLAPTYDSRWSKYIDASLRLTLELTPESRAGPVLDVACGTGKFLEILAQQPRRANLVGIDIVAAMLDEARKRMGRDATLLRCDASELPFADSTFQLIVSTNALHYFSEAEIALQEMRRVISSGGDLVITDWCRNYLGMKMLDRFLPWTSHAHVRVFTSQELENKLEQAGFRVVARRRRKIDWFWGLMTVHAVAVRQPVVDPARLRVRRHRQWLHHR